MDQTNFYKQLVDRYIENQASAEEMEVLFHLLETGEIDDILKARLQSDSDGMMANVSFSDDKEIVTLTETTSQKVKPVIPIRYLRIAASIVLITAVSLLLYQQKSAIRDLIDPVNYLTAAAENGKVRKLMLADGSVVWLNAGSKLKYPEKFNGDKRELELDGEAFFEVFHDANKPFIIYSDKVRTVVLGTSFNVKSYKNEYSQITVKTGKVAVMQESQSDKPLTSEPIMLTPAQQATYNGTTFYLKKGVNTTHYTSWVDGDLVFTGRTLMEMKPILERWYNVKINYENSRLGNCSMVGSYHKESLKNILEAMRFSLNIKYKIQGNQITISGGNCSSK